jgi:PAS domain S-box-containing protein
MQQTMSEQRQIEIELEQRNEDLAVLTSVINTINQSSSLQGVLTTTLVEIKNLLGLDHSEIWLSDELTNQLTLITSHPLPGSLSREKQSFEVGQDLPGLIAKSRKPLFIDDLSHNPDLQKKVEQFDFTCALGIPLVAREALTGVMIFFSATPSDFSPQIVSQLAILGHLIGTAIQNAHLYTNLQQRIAEQSALLIASAAISSSLDLKTVLSSLAEQLVKALKVTSAYIADWKPEAGSATVLAEYFASEASALEKVSDLGVTYYPLREFPYSGEGLRTGQIRVIHVDDPNLGEVERNHWLQYGAISIIIIPFFIKGAVIGSAEVWESRQKRDFTLDELVLCQGIAQQGAIAFENALLFEEAQREIAERKQIEEKLARQAREMVLLDQIRMAVAREVDLSAVLKKMVEAIVNTFGYALVSVYLLQNNNLILQHQIGYHKPRRKIPLVGRIKEEVIDSKQPALVKDNQATLEFSFEYEKITSRVCVPLFDQNQVIGILNVESLDGHYLGEADLRLMTTLSEYINIAIERANLFAEARGNEEKYNALIEQSNDAIYLIYGNRFEMVNRKFTELFGVTQKELNDPNFAFTNIVAPKSRKLVIEQSKLERGRQGEAATKVSPIYEFTALDKDGKEIEVELSVSYPTYKGGLATQGVLRDITERKRVEAEQATFQAQMFHSAKLASIGELAAGVAHEINNPIFSIRELADLILEDTAKDDPAYSMLETIIREANRIADIVRNLLEFSRPSETNLNPIQLQDVWELVYKLVGQSFYKQNIQLEVDIPEALPPLKARGQQLQQVLLNLLTNARDALLEKYPGSQKHPEKRITIRARQVENRFALTYPDGQEMAEVIMLTVRDEGVGISSENQERLFTPFFTTKRPKSGSGLGLSICHKIIEEHHGRIEVESEEGKFTEFRIILPLLAN